MNLRETLAQFWSGRIDINQMVGAIVQADEDRCVQLDDLSANAARDRERISALERQRVDAMPWRLQIAAQLAAVQGDAMSAGEYMHSADHLIRVHDATDMAARIDRSEKSEGMAYFDPEDWDRQRKATRALLEASGAVIEAFDNWFEARSSDAYRTSLEAVIVAENKLSNAMSAVESAWRVDEARDEAGEFPARSEPNSKG